MLLQWQVDLGGDFTSEVITFSSGMGNRTESHLATYMYTSDTPYLRNVDKMSTSDGYIEKIRQKFCVTIGLAPKTDGKIRGC